MKSSRSPKLQYKNADRKGSKRDKAQKLDRKSSRGMIFENEELRLRTININAEVERGQTDIKRLRRENDQLKREIWTLRDECDRLNKRINTKLLDHDHCNCNTRGSGGSSGCTRCPSQSNTDDSDSCDTCKGGADCDDDQCSDDCCQVPAIKQRQQQQQQQHQQQQLQHQNIAMDTSKSSSVNAVYPKFNEPQHLHNTFDHLSVVSEETLSNSEVQAAAQQQQQQHHQQRIGVAYTPGVNGSQTALPSLMGQLTPMTPLERVANQLNDLQADVPPLSYFENILQDHMGSSIGMTPDTSAISPSKKIIKHTNGWDYNLQSPFAQRRPSPATSSTSSPSSASTRSPTVKLRYPPGPSIASTLTTFVPTQITPSTIVNATDVKSAASGSGNNGKAQTNMTAAPSTQQPVIETVAITTMPTTAPPPPPTLGSPKHFFSPLKPRLKINTSLANKSPAVPAPPVVPATAAASTSEFQNCDPPDIYVTNGLASPYKRPPLPATHSPQLPQRSTSGTNSSSSSSMSPPNVSSRSRQSQQLHHYHHQQQQQQQQHITHQEHQRHQLQTQQEQQPDNKELLHQRDAALSMTVSSSSFAFGVPVGDVSAAAVAFDDANFDAALIHNTAIGSNSTFSADTANFSYTDSDNDTDDSGDADDSTTDSTTLDAHSLACANSMPALIFGVEQCTACVAQLSEPIYATARERSNSLISAPARTKPLMTATINSPSKVSFASIRLSSHSVSNLALGSAARQTESVNLETILNDIEHISEDILAIQLEKCKSRNNQNNDETAQSTSEKALQQQDKNKKPYRSEMNLQLSYDGANATIKPADVAAQEQRTHANESLRTRARSLERETTESPSPKIPDAMPAFPDNRTYIGFDQLNKDAHLQLAGSRKMHGISKSNTSSPQKPPPPTPPIRLCPPPLSLRNGSLPTVCGTPTTPQHASGEPTLVGQALAPNKSHLYKALANAAAKRAQFRLDSPTLSKSLDLELAQNVEAGTPTSLTTPTTEAARRKARRVSIVCGETPTTPDASATLPPNCTPPIQLSTASCTNLTATPTNPLLQSLKQITSHSTPNSPHSARRRTDNSLAPDDLVRHNSHHQHQRSSSSNIGAQHRRSSQDSTREATGTATVAPVATRSRCSRRHSDGTVAVGNGQRISGSSGGAHHHHHHHHHQHSASLVSNAHHIRNSHQDSNQETGSASDRNSNSFASSRESSTSFSMRSQRRKISVSSHTGGKIPWCGCWGNGCL